MKTTAQKLKAPLSLFIKVINLTDKKYHIDDQDDFIDEHIMLANTIWEKRELQTLIP